MVTLADALAPGAPLVQDPSLRPGDPLAATNVLREHRYGWGDVDAAAADAEVVVEGTYAFPMVTQFAIEPHAFMAAPDGDGIAIWSSIQHPYWLQRLMAGVLDLPLERVRVYAPDPGGAFGGKQHAKYEPLVAFLALRTGRPCRLVLSLEETFQAVRRGASEVHVRTGFRRDGSIVFRDIRADYLIGAYADIADRTVGKGSFTSNGPYLVPAVRIVGRSVLSHTVPSTAFRGFGNPQQIWAIESNLNEAARVLGIDPVALRRQNLARPGDPFIPGDTPADGDWRQSLRPRGRDDRLGRARRAGSRSRVRGGPQVGPDDRALECHRPAARRRHRRPLLRHVGHGPGGAHDLRPDRRRGAGHPGRGDHRRHGRHGDRALRPADLGQSIDGDHGSGDPAGRASRSGSSSAESAARGGEVVGHGQHQKDGDQEHPLGGTAAFFEFNATAVEVEVDRETGDVTVTRHVTVSDVGRALNPMQVRGQDEGAAIMGLGHTLMERMILDDEGRIRNLGAIDYRIPTSMDLPLRIESDIVENGDGPGPYGAKGMSEGALLPVAPAVAEAVRDAVGVDIRDLPLSPERVWRALQELDR